MFDVWSALEFLSVCALEAGLFYSLIAQSIVPVYVSFALLGSLVALISVLIVL